MDFVFQPWQLYLVILAGSINRQQQEVINYLRTENQVLKEEVGTLFTPDTILRWHRMLIAKKWDYSDKRKNVGRPGIRRSSHR